MLVQKLQLEHWHRDDQLHGKLAECQAQVVNLQGIVAELSSEAAADMVSLSNAVHCVSGAPTVYTVPPLLTLCFHSS